MLRIVTIKGPFKILSVAFGVRREELMPEPPHAVGNLAALSASTWAAA